jgi:hypothetical protein
MIHIFSRPNETYRPLLHPIPQNWPDTIRNVLLFLFFGLFGGRNALSRNILLLGAPLSVILQARIVKRYWKQAFYACAHPPSILLSLLPAPQQSILKFQYDDVQKVLYPENQVTTTTQSTKRQRMQQRQQPQRVSDSDNDEDDEDDDEE